jgi:hypothetical protein
LQRSGLEALHRLEHRVFDLTQAGFRMRLTPRYELMTNCVAQHSPPRQHAIQFLLIHRLLPPALSASRSVTLPDYAKLRRAPVNTLLSELERSAIGGLDGVRYVIPTWDRQAALKQRVDERLRRSSRDGLGDRPSGAQFDELGKVKYWR